MAIPFLSWGHPTKELNDRFRRAGPLGAPEFASLARWIEQLKQDTKQELSRRKAAEQELEKLAFLLWLRLVDFIPAGFRVKASSYPYEEKIRCLKEALGLLADPLRTQWARRAIEQFSQDLPPEWKTGLARLPWKEALDLAWIFAALEQFIPFLPPGPRYAIRGLMKRSITPDLAEIGHSLLRLCAEAAAGNTEVIPRIAEMARAPLMSEHRDHRTLSFSPAQRILQTAMLPEIQFA